MAAIAWEEIKIHNTEADVWIAIHGNVYNVTNFLENHPGGKGIVLELAGQDATDAFEEAAHSTEARDILLKLLVGRLKDHHDEVRTFESMVHKPAQAEVDGSSGTRTVRQVLFSLLAFTSLAYGRHKIPDIWPSSRPGFASADPLWTSAVVVLLLSLGAFCRFVSHVIYVDYGRLDKHPSRISLE